KHRWFPEDVEYGSVADC
ncbi:hypothetical protein TcasGA2_TC001641, partial [Tribolium castaneum]